MFKLAMLPSKKVYSVSWGRMRKHCYLTYLHYVLICPLFPVSRRKILKSMELLSMQCGFSYVGESGFELHHEISDQEALLNLLLEAGRKYDLGFLRCLCDEQYAARKRISCLGFRFDD